MSNKFLSVLALPPCQLPIGLVGFSLMRSCVDDPLVADSYLGTLVTVHADWLLDTQILVGAGSKGVQLLNSQYPTLAYFLG